MSVLILLFALNMNITVAATPEYFKKFESPSLLQGKFEQVKKIKDLDVSISSQGDFKITRLSARQATVYWNVMKPEPMKVCITEDQLTFKDMTSNKTTVLKLSEMSSKDTSGLGKLIQLLNLGPDQVSKDFHVEKQAQGLKLVPIDHKQFPFQSAEFAFDTKKNLKNVLITEASGDSLEIHFSKTKESVFDPKKEIKSECL